MLATSLASQQLGYSCIQFRLCTHNIQDKETAKDPAIVLGPTPVVWFTWLKLKNSFKFVGVWLPSDDP